MFDRLSLRNSFVSIVMLLLASACFSAPAFAGTDSGDGQSSEYTFDGVPPVVEVSPLIEGAEDVGSPYEGELDTQAVDDTYTPQAVGATTQAIYRMYLPANGEHLYTTDSHEASVLHDQHGWTYENIAWFAPSSGAPVYRLYNAALQNHLYTTDNNEVKVLTTREGWTKDNGGAPLFYSGGSLSIYRLYNPALRGLHLLTNDRNEYNVLPKYQWKQEGVALSGSYPGSEGDVYPQGSYTISNTPSSYSIECDVTLTGKGKGYHAKLVACTPLSAVSFGIQYDNGAAVPYTDLTSFLIENVADNNPGGQRYTHTGIAKTNTTYHLMMTVQKNGRVDFFVNGNKVGSVNNSRLANTAVTLRVEGSAKKNGDSLTATFDNIELKNNGVYNPSKSWGTYEFRQNPGLISNTSAFLSNHRIVVSGKMTGLTSSQDWDSAYDKVSGIIQFVG